MKIGISLQYFCFAIICMTSLQVIAQPMKNWHLLDYKTDGVYGISVEALKLAANIR